MDTRKRYSKEFKLDAISLVLEQGYSRAEAARSLGINANMLCRWIKERGSTPFLRPDAEVLQLCARRKFSGEASNSCECSCLLGETARNQNESLLYRTIDAPIPEAVAVHPCPRAGHE